MIASYPAIFNLVEQKGGILHTFNSSNFELLGFQILVIWDLKGKKKFKLW